MLSFSITHLLRLHILLTVLVSCNARTLASPPVSSSLVTSFVPVSRIVTSSYLVGNFSTRAHLPRPLTSHTSTPRLTDAAETPWGLPQFVRDVLVTVRGILLATSVQWTVGWLRNQLLRQSSSASPRSAGEAEVVDDVEVVEEGPGQHPGDDEAGDDVVQGDERVLVDMRRLALQLLHEEQEDMENMECWRRWQ